jgi:transcriptional regulator with XRE-family HTH domain
MTTAVLTRRATMAETFGAVLKRLREAADLSQMDLAVKAGLNLFTVAKLEQGQREPTWATAQALAAALRVSCEAFVTGPPTGQADEPPPKPKGKGKGKK